MTDEGPKLSTTIQGMRDALAEAYPGWVIWVVPMALGGETWCARRELAGTCEVHGGSAGELADHIRLKLEDEAAAGRQP